MTSPMNKLSQLLENLATQCQLEKGKPERSEGKEVEAASEKLKDYVSSKSRISSNITASKTEQSIAEKLKSELNTVNTAKHNNDSKFHNFKDLKMVLQHRQDTVKKPNKIVRGRLQTLVTKYDKLKFTDNELREEICASIRYWSCLTDAILCLKPSLMNSHIQPHSINSMLISKAFLEIYGVYFPHHLAKLFGNWLHWLNKNHEKGKKPMLKDIVTKSLSEKTRDQASNIDPTIQLDQQQLAQKHAEINNSKLLETLMLHRILVHVPEDFYSDAINHAYKNLMTNRSDNDLQDNHMVRLYEKIWQILEILYIRMQDRDERLREVARETMMLMYFSSIYYLNGSSSANYANTRKKTIKAELERLNTERVRTELEAAVPVNSPQHRDDPYGLPAQHTTTATRDALTSVNDSDPESDSGELQDRLGDLRISLVAGVSEQTSSEFIQDPYRHFWSTTLKSMNDDVLEFLDVAEKYFRQACRLDSNTGFDLAMQTPISPGSQSLRTSLPKIIGSNITYSSSIRDSSVRFGSSIHHDNSFQQTSQTSVQPESITHSDASDSVPPSKAEFTKSLKHFVLTTNASLMNFYQILSFVKSGLTDEYDSICDAFLQHFCDRKTSRKTVINGWKPDQNNHKGILKSSTAKVSPTVLKKQFSVEYYPKSNSDEVKQENQDKHAVDRGDSTSDNNNVNTGASSFLRHFSTRKQSTKGVRVQTTSGNYVPGEFDKPTSVKSTENSNRWIFGISSEERYGLARAQVLENDDQNTPKSVQSTNIDAPDLTNHQEEEAEFSKDSHSDDFVDWSTLTAFYQNFPEQLLKDQEKSQQSSDSSKDSFKNGDKNLNPTKHEWNELFLTICESTQLNKFIESIHHFLNIIIKLQDVNSGLKKCLQLDDEDIAFSTDERRNVLHVAKVSLDDLVFLTLHTLGKLIFILINYNDNNRFGEVKIDFAMKLYSEIVKFIQRNFTDKAEENIQRNEQRHDSLVIRKPQLSFDESNDLVTFSGFLLQLSKNQRLEKSKLLEVSRIELDSRIEPRMDSMKKNSDFPENRFSELSDIKSIPESQSIPDNNSPEEFIKLLYEHIWKAFMEKRVSNKNTVSRDCYLYLLTGIVSYGAYNVDFKQGAIRKWKELIDEVFKLGLTPSVVDTLKSFYKREPHYLVETNTGNFEQLVKKVKTQLMKMVLSVLGKPGSKEYKILLALRTLSDMYDIVDDGSKDSQEYVHHIQSTGLET